MFYDIFKQLAEKKGISVHKATQELGLSKSTATKWKKTAAIPHSETLQKIADYFDVPLEYLLTGDTQEKTPPADAEGDIDSMLSVLLDSPTIMLDGKIASPEAAEYLRNSFEAVIEHAKKMNENKK